MAKNPILFIGLGGMGINTVRKIYEKQSGLSLKERQHINYLNIDFETKDLLKAPDSITSRAYRHSIGLKNAGQQIRNWFKDDRDGIKAWWPRTKLNGESSIYLPVITPVGGAAAGQVRANGAIAFYGNFNEGSDLKGKLDKIVDTLHKYSLEDDINPNQKRIFVITSLGGGTGSGIFPDLISYLRTHHEIGPDDRIYGVFYDPTLMTKLLSTTWDTHQGMAALVETDHWMSNFNKYTKSYGNGSHIVEGKNSTAPGQKWLHGVYLIQSHTSDDKLFLGDAYEKYTDMVSEYLSLLSTLDDYSEKVETNEMSRLDMLPDYNGRSVKYGSFGIAEIKVPINDIKEYIIARLLVERDQPNLLNGEDNLNSHAIKFLKRFTGLNSESAIDLLDLQSLFHQQEVYEHRIAKVHGMAQDKLSKGITRDKGIINPQRYTNYIKDLEPFAKKLEQHFSRILLETISEFLETLQFEEILNWLETLGVLLAAQRDSLTKNPPVSITEDEEKGISATYEYLEKALNILGSTKQTNVFTRERTAFRIARDEALDLYEQWHRQNLFHVEVNLATGIYDHFTKTLQQMIAKVSALRDGYSRFLMPFRRKLANTRLRTPSGEALYSRGSIFSAERFKRNEYTLALLVDIPDEYINKKLQDIRKTHSAERVMGPILKSGGGGKQPALELNFTDPGRIKKYFQEISDERLIPDITNRVHEEFNIETALEAYLSHFYNMVLENQTGLAREDMSERISLEFGEKYRDSLMETSMMDSPEEWKKLALQALFERIGAIASPFWRVSEVERGQWRDDWKKRGVEVHQKIQKPIHFLIMPKFKNLPAIELKEFMKFFAPEKMNDRVAFLIMDVGSPLHCVMQTSGLQQIFNQYLDHILSSNMPPAHIDQRFIDRATDITKPPKDNDLGVILYILGLSFQLIKRDGKKYYIDQDKPIALGKSYDSLRTFLMEGDAKLLEFIGEQISQRLGKAWYENKKDLKTLHKIFIEGCEAHISTNKPVGLTNAQWREKVTGDIGVEYEIDSDGEFHILKYGIIPTNADEVERLIDQLGR